MDYRSLVHDKDEAIYSEIRVIVLDIRGFYVSRAEQSPKYLPPYCRREMFKMFFYLFTTGRAVRYHQQESGKGDQSERRGETFHVLKLEGGGGGGGDVQEAPQGQILQSPVVLVTGFINININQLSLFSHAACTSEPSV